MLLKFDPLQIKGKNLFLRVYEMFEPAFKTKMIMCLKLHRHSQV